MFINLLLNHFSDSMKFGYVLLGAAGLGALMFGAPRLMSQEYDPKLLHDFDGDGKDDGIQLIQGTRDYWGDNYSVCFVDGEDIEKRGKKMYVKRADERLIGHFSMGHGYDVILNVEDVDGDGRPDISVEGWSDELMAEEKILSYFRQAGKGKFRQVRRN